MNSWKKRNITMIGKIMIAKSLIIPNITYVASVTNIDKEYVSKFKTIIYKFIWNDKREKVKRETMNKNYLEGGLKMIDIDKYIEAIQIKWIKKIFSILSLQCFKHPIHIPSVLFLFSIRPENEPNVSIILKAIDISILD
jgi:hypothetical protein